MFLFYWNLEMINGIKSKNYIKRKYLHIIEVHKKYMDIACNRFRKSNKNIEVINDICSVTTDIYRNDGSHKYLATYRFNPDIIYINIYYYYTLDINNIQIYIDIY